jgi:hypothetical protein
MALPNSVIWKAFRSETHLREFQAELHQYFVTNPGKVVRDPGGNPDEFVGTFQAGAPIPGRLPIIIGDCLQNLRSALDYLVWELVLASGNEPGRHNMFPICATEEAFSQSVSRHRLKGVVSDAIAEIKGMQPYHYGCAYEKAMLWVLDDLCNINKHRRVLTTELCGGPSNLELRLVNGELFAHVDLASIKKDAKIGPFPIVDGPSSLLKKLKNLSFESSVLNFRLPLCDV